VTIQDALKGRIWVTEMGRIKWHLAAEFVVGEEVRARAEQIGLFIRLSTRRPIAPPAALRERFAPGTAP
jgi:acyl-CoA thioester hydrolase